MSQREQVSTHWGFRLLVDYRVQFKNSSTGAEIAMSIPEKGLGHDPNKIFTQAQVQAIAEAIEKLLEANT